MKTENKKNLGSAPMIHPDHPRPVTRRQLLSHGFYSASAITFAPTIFSAMLSRAAFAEGEPTLPFMVFDMAGGAALPGNFLVGKAGGPEDLLANYDLLGWNPRAASSLDKQFGLPMAAGVSGMLAGILASTSVAARANLRMGSILHYGQDDTSSNQLSSASLVAKSQASPAFLQRILGTSQQMSGGNSSLVPVASYTTRPLQVRSVDDVTQASGLSGALTTLPTEGLAALAQGSLDLTKEQLVMLRRFDRGDQLAALSEVAFQKNVDDLQNRPNVDPRADALVSGAYGITAATATNDIRAVTAAIVMNALKSYTGPGVISIGGCDYHGSQQATTDAKDNEMGQHLGRAIEAAHRLQKPLFFQLITDGGCSARQGVRQWRSDDGTKCMTVIGYYRPTGPAPQRRLQVGAYSDGQGVDMSTVVGAQPARAGIAAFANYLAAAGKTEEDIARMIPQGVFTRQQLAQVLIFG